MVVFPNAKINLGLLVTEKRPDGFHNIQTVFYPVPLREALELLPSSGGEIKFMVSGKEVPGGTQNNIILKAWQMLKDDFGLPGATIHLHKTIPIGAGLGGGSSDAAFMLKLARQVFDLDVSDEELMDYARRLGSDCAFFILNKPVAAFGRGDEFSKIQLDLSAYHLVIVKPEIHIGTAEAYAWVKPSAPKHDIMEIIRQPVSEWKKHLTNDFEPPVFEKYPLIGEIKSRLYRHGALYASMSGSGSAVYGIFPENPGLEDAFEGHFYWEGKLSME
ncbi:MAG: 4-(cytidine 5'-diphospho)-2-C-methyl-D-erythritol kinase [Bacteroidales bacterium]